MSRGGRLHGSASRDTRAQLVLVAAAAIALALVPMTIAYLQLGYAGDVSSEPTGAAPGADAERALDRAVHDAAAEVVGEYRWTEREAAADAFREAIADDLRDIETARLDRGIAAEVTYAPDLAENVASGAAGESGSDDTTDVCPRGENRAFGPCEADGGVVVQERAGETVVVAAAVDVHMTRTDGTTELSLVVAVDG